MSAGSRPVDKPMSRLGCLLTMGLWLCLMTVPLLTFILAVKGEVSWQRGEFVKDRLWLVRLPGEAGHDETYGLAYSADRVVSDQRPAQGPVCVHTRVYFLLWKSSGADEDADFCECYLPAPGGGYEAAGNCP